MLGLDAKRVQFTPDLMPSDIIGSEVLEDVPGKPRSFRLVKGPIFTQLLMADEINRASPRTQSALLQAMQEHHVTVAGARYDIPTPFHVLATQNPLEHEGTYPLPEAQLDRFLLQIDVTYPDVIAERRMLFATTGTDERRLEAVLTGSELMSIQRLVRQIPVPDKVVDAILKLVRSARPGTGASEETDRFVAWGPGPRASQALMLAVRAKALIDGRLAPSVDDVLALADPVLKHRMALTFAARAEGQDLGAIITPARRGGGVSMANATAPQDLRRSQVLSLEREAHGLADRLPDILIEAQRIAQTVAHGIHGRRRAGPGETFWQFRQFQQSDTARQIDWRRSASSDHLYVREREWEAAHTVWLWPDLSPSMDFRATSPRTTKRDRALLLTLASAELLVRGGERVALLGLDAPDRQPQGDLAHRRSDRRQQHARRCSPRRSRRRRTLRALPERFCSATSSIPSSARASTSRRWPTMARSGISSRFSILPRRRCPTTGAPSSCSPAGDERWVADRVQSLRSRYRERLEAHRAELAAFTRRLGWSFLVHHTDRPAAEPLLTLIMRLQGGIGDYRWQTQGSSDESEARP